MLQDLVKRYPTSGLPLFDSTGNRAPARAAAVIETAPRAIEVATSTRNLAYRTLIYNVDDLSERQREALQVLSDSILAGDTRNFGWTNMEIARHLLWSVNCVTPRIFELRRLGLVIPFERRKCDVTGCMAQAWAANAKRLFKEEDPSDGHL